MRRFIVLFIALSALPLVAQDEQVDPTRAYYRARELFDQQEMRRLFAVGYDLGRQAQPWKQHPPGPGDSNSSYRIPTAAAKKTAGG